MNRYHRKDKTNTYYDIIKAKGKQALNTIWLIYVGLTTMLDMHTWFF